MKRYIFGTAVGVIIGAGLMLTLIVAIIPVQAQSILLDNPNAIIWLENDAYYDNLANVSKITTGGIIVGYLNEGTPYQQPIVKQGIAIEFDKPPTSAILEKLDLEMSTKGMTREGGITVTDKLIEHDAAIDTINTELTAKAVTLSEETTEPINNPLQSMIKYWRESKK